MDQPSAETLAAVWNHMKENGLAAPNEEFETAHKIGNARSVEEIREALGGRSSSMLGR